MKQAILNQISLLQNNISKKYTEPIINSLFKQQRDFLFDPSNYKAAVCSRRAGKSHVCGTNLLLTALQKPGSISLYIALTRDSAKRIMWYTLQDMCRQFNIKVKENESDLLLTLENGSRIYLVGADMKRIIERLRGPKYATVVLDEAGSFGLHIKELIDDVLTPALIDWRGSILMVGTPPPVRVGFFYDTVLGSSEGYSVHKWTLLDNPHLPDPKSFLEDILKRKNWTKDNPTYQREYMGIFTDDFDSLVYKFKSSRNLYSADPVESDLKYVLGLDYGWNDATAWSIVAFSNASRKAYCIYNYAKKELTASQIADHTKSIISKYDIDYICADTGGLGKTITEELKRRYQIPIEAAQKTEKNAWIELLNGDFIDRNLFINESLTELIFQLKTLQKDDKGKELEGMSNDRTDSLLYAYRKAYHFIHIPLEKEKSEEDIFRQEVERQFKEEQEELWQ